MDFENGRLRLLGRFATETVMAIHFYDFEKICPETLLAKLKAPENTKISLKLISRRLA